MTAGKTHKNSVAMEAANLSDADYAILIASSLGTDLDEWQKEILRDWLALDDNGNLIHRTCGLSVPRQNGKSLCIEFRILFGMMRRGERFVYSSHRVDSAADIFKRLKSYFENEDFPEMQKMVKYIRNTNGQERIELKNGAFVKFMSRSNGAGRGGTVDTIIFDESQQLTDGEVGALTPMTFTSSRAQIIYAGTPPFDDSQGETFTRFRTQGLTLEEGSTSPLSWIEYSADADDDIEDVATWKKANPAFAAGRVNATAVLESAVATMAEDMFRREHLGQWGLLGAGTVVDMDQWIDLADQFSEIIGEVVLGVDVSPNRDLSSLAAVGLSSNGRVHLEIDDNRRDASWLIQSVKRLNDRRKIRALVIDRQSQAYALLSDFERILGKARVIVTSASDLAAGSAMMIDAVIDGTVTHTDQPPLNIAFGSAKKRKLGDSFAFSRTSSTADITPLVAVTLAHWYYKQKMSDNNDGATERRRRILVLK